jgi:hypothetical protein
MQRSPRSSLTKSSRLTPKETVNTAKTQTKKNHRSVLNTIQIILRITRLWVFIKVRNTSIFSIIGLHPTDLTPGALDLLLVVKGTVRSIFSSFRIKSVKSKFRIELFRSLKLSFLGALLTLRKVILSVSKGAIIYGKERSMEKEWNTYKAQTIAKMCMEVIFRIKVAEDKY